MKSHYAQYSCVVIVLFNTALRRSAFSTVSFRKLVFFFLLYVLSLNQDIKNCVIMLCNFVLTLYKKTHLSYIKKLFKKVLQYYVKMMSGTMLPGKMSLRKMPPGKLPPGNKPLRKIAPQENCPQEYCPPGKLFR